MVGHNAPYVPGWDCHGLPIELQVDRNLGPKKKQMSAVAFRKACREYAEKFVAIQKAEFERLGRAGGHVGHARWPTGETAQHCERPLDGLHPRHQIGAIRPETLPACVLPRVCSAAGRRWSSARCRQAWA